MHCHLWIGIVKKNAIMMIDFALEGQRKQGKCPGRQFWRLSEAFPAHHDNGHGGSAWRFAACVGTGTGSELRRPLGISIGG